MDEITIIIIGVLVFVCSIIGSMNYSVHLKHECNLKAMEQKYPAVEIQSICKY